jgi:hypothetical protein
MSPTVHKTIFEPHVQHLHAAPGWTLLLGDMGLAISLGAVLAFKGIGPWDFHNGIVRDLTAEP